MPGYQLIQQRSLLPPNPKGIPANKQRIGFLDFLRELEQDEFPYDAESSLLVVGLEDVLILGRSSMEDTCKYIHGKLQRAAKHFEGRNCGYVQIIFRNELVAGATLRVIHPTVELPIHLIFGSPPYETDRDGNVFYRCAFNLSSIH